VATQTSRRAMRRVSISPNRVCLPGPISIVRAEALTGAGHPAEALRVLDEIAPALDESRRAPLKITRVCAGSARRLYWVRARVPFSSRICWARRAALEFQLWRARWNTLGNWCGSSAGRRFMQPGDD
jgi:hypothetical protein